MFLQRDISRKQWLYRAFLQKSGGMATSSSTQNLPMPSPSSSSAITMSSASLSISPSTSQPFLSTIQPGGLSGRAHRNSGLSQSDLETLQDRTRKQHKKAEREKRQVERKQKKAAKKAQKKSSSSSIPSSSNGRSTISKLIQRESGLSSISQEISEDQGEFGSDDSSEFDLLRTTSSNTDLTTSKPSGPSTTTREDDLREEILADSVIFPMDSLMLSSSEALRVQSLLFEHQDVKMILQEEANSTNSSNHSAHSPSQSRFKRKDSFYQPTGRLRVQIATSEGDSKGNGRQRGMSKLKDETDPEYVSVLENRIASLEIELDDEKAKRRDLELQHEQLTLSYNALLKKSVGIK
eukprot:TRINITY_DN4545_c0_g1_i1.p1 TRINITY_DN4545_c0_g1~~TRINITY_DN4545_c0_g1_i1.p1  ORF type:complete len:351 (+),score=86.04 TRINITY_DN4545_c0_g1_i1:336-1388(+)